MSHPAEDSTVRPSLSLHHVHGNFLMPRAHLIQQVLCSFRTPPMRVVVSQVFKYIRESYFTAWERRQGSNVPSDLRMSVDECQQGLRSKFCRIGGCPVSSRLSIGRDDASDDKETGTTLRHKMNCIDDESVH